MELRGNEVRKAVIAICHQREFLGNRDFAINLAKVGARDSG